MEQEFSEFSEFRESYKSLMHELQGYTRRYTYNQLQAKPDNGKHR